MNQYVVRADPKALGQQGFKRIRTTLDIDHPPAIVTLKVVVVQLVGELVATRFPRKLNCSQLALLDEPREVPVDGRDADAGQLGLSRIEEFLRR